MKKFGKYEVISEIAQGSMGLIYKVQIGGREFALKTLRKQVYSEDNEENQLRFQREMELSLKIDHPKIVKMIDCQLVEEPPFMVMDYLPQGSVEKLLESQKTLSPQEILKMAKDVALALVEIESQGIVHRDIKPGNILIDGDNFKLTDLGLARLTEADYEDGLTLSQTALGTPDYVSPEQVMHASGVDIRSDIYSLGATLYHCLTGKKVHEGGSQLQLMMKHVSEPITSPLEIDGNFPESLSVVIMTMLEKNIEDRYQSPEAILEDLELISIGDVLVGDKHELVRPMNRIGMLMFACFVLLFLFAGGVFIKMACLPPVKDDYFYLRQRAELRSSMKVVSSEALLHKANAIDEFVKKYPRDVEVEKMKRAVFVAHEVANGGDFQLLVKKAGYFNEALKFEVHLFIGGQKFTIPSHSEKKAIFPNEKISFKWHPGMKVRLQLEQISWVNKILLDQEISEKVSLKALSREYSYKVDAAVAELLQNGEFHLSLSLQKMTPKDWQLFEDYIYPGNKW